MHNVQIPGFTSLSKEQYEAATCGMGPVLISAGPGSGKTFTIVHRIVYLIREMGYSPHDIYVITFTKDAALSMNKRYQEILQEMKGTAPDMESVHFGTFHSFFYQIIRSHHKYRNYKLLNTSGRSGILFRVLKKRGQNGAYGKELRNLLADISFYKNTGKFPEGQSEDFAELVKAYEEEKCAAKMLDFDDMLTLCLELLQEDEKLRETWQRKIGYLMVDEFQDTNAVQYEVVKLLVREPHPICVVGDDDQAIYGFRGSEPGIMRQFLEDFPGAKHYHLGTNYRCCKKIVACSRALIEKNKQRISKRLTAGTDSGGGRVDVKDFATYGRMTEYCLGALEGKDIGQLSETAVLFRTNLRMNLFLMELLKRRIPFRTKEKITSVYEHFVVKDIMDYLNAAAGCRERGLFLRILNKPRTHIGREALLEELVDMEEVAAFYGPEGVRNYPAMHDALRFQKGLENLKKLRLPLGIDFILNYFGYAQYLRNKANGDMELYEEWLGILQWLKEDSRGFSDIRQWEQFQKEHIFKAQRWDEEKDKVQEGVCVMTLHGCKGLEFRQVYIMHVNEGNIPSIKKGKEVTAEMLEEERRLFYVGMTRAKEALELLCVRQTQESPRPPSRFLKELQA